MKIKNIVLALFMLSNLAILAQSKFSVGLSYNQQIVKKDVSKNLNFPEGFISYDIDEEITLSLSGSSITMDKNSSDIDYELNKFAMQVWYKIGQNNNIKFHSIFGFSYLMFDDKLALQDDNGLGLDFGFQVFFGEIFNKLDYGIKLISTFSDFSPGGILSSGFTIVYRL